MPTRKTNQIDIDLSRIFDANVRDALAGILNLVNGFIGIGLDTEGTLKARNGIGSGAGGDLSLVHWLVKAGTLAPNTGAEDHYDRVIIPGRILGVSGWVQFNGSTEWRLIGVSTTTTVFVSLGAGPPQNFENEVVFVNSDNTNYNSYRSVIFYQPTVIDRQTGIS